MGASIMSAQDTRCVFAYCTYVASVYLNYEMLQENPNIANESAHAQAREALKKYLHYFERVSPLQPIHYSNKF